MRLNSKAWMAISLVLFAGAVYFWHKGDVEVAARRARAASQTPTAASSVATPKSTPAAAAATPAASTNASVPLALRYRVTNTTRPMSQLQRDDRAVLLRNALIDTRLPADLPIPDELKAGENPGSYVVQSRTALNAAFYDLLRQAGAGFVSYVPNNAALVTATPEAAGQLRGNSMVVSVLPYAPYYKLDSTLLGVILENQSRGANDLIGVTAFPQGREALQEKLESMGVTVLSEESTPFGHEFVVHSTDLVALAQASEVQEIEATARRAVLNDLTRPVLQVAEDTVVETNYLQLTGTNVVVAVNDSGVDASHPDLTGRVFAAPGAGASALTDTQTISAGHGTHVASIIGGTGAKSTTVTNAFGSVLPAVDKQFRGKAPGVKILVQSVDMVSGPMVSDTYLQETASKSNAFINNNSWGYPSATAYSMSSASYDAATRDAQTGVTGSQPLLFVFAAGNDGNGGDDGTGGISDSILSPANAKNVIAVGALETPRSITNEVAIDGVTNAIWLAMTDTSWDVASYSSRGNVGVGVEGDYGRVKPDVVAPGTFIVAARSTKFEDPNAEASTETFSYSYQTALPGKTNVTDVYVPPGGVLMAVVVSPNSLSPTPFPTNFLILADTNTQPQTVRSSGTFAVTNADWYVGVVSPVDRPINYDLTIYVLITNSSGNMFEVLSNLNTGLGQYYRYETGTSMAAPAVTGLLALMTEFLNKIGITSPSPALMKALLINGARPTTDYYTYDAKLDGPNYEGWGVAQLANSIPQAWTATNTGPVQVFDQSPESALVTGQSHVRHLKLAETNDYLRVTLVWTDPPGNPACSIKLVNDLDLIVSNTATGEVFVGNNFPAQSVFTAMTTNKVDSDIVNNVENVYISAGDVPLASEYDIIVKGKRVNVNAVTAHPDGIAQDYALVISSGNTTSTAPFVVDAPVVHQDSTPWVMSLSNGVPVLYQHVGANSPMINWPVGSDTQWRFFVFTNEAKPTNTPYVALLTFMPPNLSTPRNTDADIDLYVSTSPALTNLDAAALASAFKSVNRGGTEVITFSNSSPGTVYYCGVKAEDQKAAEFGFLAIASASPFSQKDGDGNIIAQGMPLPMQLIDGSPLKPSKVPIFAIGIDADNPASKIRRVVVREKLNTAMNGDIYGVLNRGSSQGGNDDTVVNNHSDHGTNLVVFDDLAEVAKSIHTDGPGTLRQYVGDPVSGGAWVLWAWDNAVAHSGMVEEFNVLISPRPQDNNDFYVTLDAYSSYFDYIDVPTDATNLEIAVTFQSGQGPVDISVRLGDYPPPADAATNGLTAPGGAFNLSSSDTPVALSGGRWFYQLYNNSAAQVTLHVIITVKRRMVPNLVETFVNTNSPTALLDDASTNSTVYVPVNQNVLATSVGVRLDHPRVSDLALSLTSPQGTRVLLFENRGGTNATALGVGTSNYVYAYFTEDTNVTAEVIKFATPPYGTTNDMILTNVTVFDSGFENIAATLYTNGQTVDGWTVATNYWKTNRVVTSGATNSVVISVSLTNEVSVVTDSGSIYAGKQALALGNGRIYRVENNLSVGKAYRLSYAYRGDGINHWWPGDGKPNDLVGNVIGVTNGAVIYQNAEVKQGFGFDGTGGDVTFGTDTGNFGFSSFTIDFWLQTTYSGGEQAVFEKRVTCDAGYFYSIRMLNGYLSVELHDTARGDSPVSIGSTRQVSDGNFHHIAMVRDGVNLSLYLDGKLNGFTQMPYPFNLSNTAAFRVGNSICSGVDSTVPFSGQIDEMDLFTRALSPAEVFGIYQSGAAGKYAPSAPYPSADIVLNGVTNTVISISTNWQTNALVFIASNTVATIELDGNPLGLLLDSIRLEEMAQTNYNNYFRPEESLDAFKGEKAQGTWTLGILDTRTGKGIGASLLSWDLQLTFSSTNVTLVALTNGVTFTNTIAANSIQYFGVDVPEIASYATNVLKSINPGDPLDLLFNQSGLPTGNLPGDSYLLASTVAGTNVLSLGSIPILVPGQRYFLGVNNPNPVPEQFTLNVSFDVVTNINLTVLTNGISYNAALSSTNSIQYYAYDVSSNATMVSFELLNLTNDLELLVRHKLPVPSVKNFDYLSDNPGTQNEMILIRTDSTPVPLAPGRWYVGVVGYGVNSGNYTVRATEWNSSLVVLTNNVPYTNTVPTNSVRFFAVDVPQLAVQETNSLKSLSGGNLSLYFNQTILPTNGNIGTVGLLLSVASGLSVLNETNAPVLQPGLRYYLSVSNAAATPQQFVVEVAANIETNVTVIALTNAVAYTNLIDVSSKLQYYSFDVAATASRAAFEILNADGNVGLVARHNLPLPDRTSYDAISDNPGTNDESIIVVTNGASLSLSSGLWYLAVYNNETAKAVNYQVRASEWLTTNVVVLTNQQDYTATVPSSSLAYFAVDVPLEVVATTNFLSSTNPLSLYYSVLGLPTGILPGDYTLLNAVTDGSSLLTLTSAPVLQPGGRYYLAVANTNATDTTFTIHVDFDYTVTLLTNLVAFDAVFPNLSTVQYYSYDVSPSARGVAFEVLNPSGDVDLLVSRNLPLPTASSYDYISANPGAQNEQIIIVTNSTPTPLAPGRWYLGVVKPAGSGPVDYTVLATEWGAPPVPPTELTNGVAMTNTVGSNSVSYFWIYAPTNTLSTSQTLGSLDGTSMLSLWFNRNGLPGIGVPGDFTLLDQIISDVAVLDVTGPAPTVLPGAGYYLAVVNTNDMPVQFKLQVDFELAAPVLVVPLTNAVAYSTNVTDTNSPQYYSFVVSSSASLMAFDIYGNDGNVDLYIRRGLPLPTTFIYDYSGNNPFDEAESILVRPDSTPVKLTPGAWYAAVYSVDPVNYTIRATELTNAAGPVIVPLADGAPLTSVAGPGAFYDAALDFEFYQFVVTNDAPALVVSLANLTGDVNLLVRQGAYPSFDLFEFQSTNSGLVPEVVLVQTNSGLPSLNGLWYVAVPNRLATNVSFDITATTIQTNAIAPTIDESSFVFTTNSFSFSWNAIPGVTYAVDTSTNLPIFYEVTNMVSSTTNATFINVAPTSVTEELQRYFRLRVVGGQ